MTSADPATGACPSWCADHRAAADGTRVHVGPMRSIDVRARRPTDPESAEEHDRLTAQLVQYDGQDGTVWISVGTRTGEPIEVAIDDANRWVILLGSAMVDAGSPGC